jgi:hypothetical protein
VRSQTLWIKTALSENLRTADSYDTVGRYPAPAKLAEVTSLLRGNVARSTGSSVRNSTLWQEATAMDPLIVKAILPSVLQITPARAKSAAPRASGRKRALPCHFPNPVKLRTNRRSTICRARSRNTWLGVRGAFYDLWK